MEYEEVIPRSKNQAEAALSRDLPEELHSVVLSVGLFADDLKWAQCFCAKLTSHPDEITRGNAILAFGHLARRFGSLDELLVRPIITKANSDSSLFVQGQLEACKEDLQWFLGWAGLTTT
jgi:hypothetical protein